MSNLEAEVVGVFVWLMVYYAILRVFIKTKMC